MATIFTIDAPRLSDTLLIWDVSREKLCDMTLGDITSSVPLTRYTADTSIPKGTYANIRDAINNSSEVAKCASENSWYYVPEGLYYAPDISFNGSGAFHYGPGQIVTNTDNQGATIAKRANIVLNIDAPPTTINAGNSILHNFDGDFKSPLNMQATITGAFTAGTPTGSYIQWDEIVPLYISSHYASGQQAVQQGGRAINGARTGWSAIRSRVFHAGRGDAAAYNANVFIAQDDNTVTTGMPGKPAGIIFNGQILMGANNVYANVTEYLVKDRGYEGMAIGGVYNFVRDNDGLSTTGSGSTTGNSLGQFWAGLRVQSKAKACDAGYQVVGDWKVGLDTTTGSATMKAVTLRSGQAIHFDATAGTMPVDVSYLTYAKTFGDTRMHFNSTTNTLDTEVLGIPSISSSNTKTEFKTKVLAASGISSTDSIEINGVKVLGPKQTLLADPDPSDQGVVTGSLLTSYKELLGLLKAHGLIHYSFTP